MLERRALTETIIGLTVGVHRTVGSGLLESDYVGCMAAELSHAGVGFETQVSVPVIFTGFAPPPGFRADNGATS